MSHGLIPNSKYLPNHPTEYEAYFSAHLLHELFLFSFIWYFCVGSEKVQSRVRLLCLLYKTILPWGMARRKLKGWGSLANSFIPLPLISAFCIKKQREEEEEQRSRLNILEEYLGTVKYDKVCWSRKTEICYFFMQVNFVVCLKVLEIFFLLLLHLSSARLF